MPRVVALVSREFHRFYMDDKTFIAAYVASETQRINEELKKMVLSDAPPSEDEKERVISDIETTLSRLQSALSHIHTEIGLEEDVDEEKE